MLHELGLTLSLSYLNIPRRTLLDLGVTAAMAWRPDRSCTQECVCGVLQGAYMYGDIVSLNRESKYE